MNWRHCILVIDKASLAWDHWPMGIEIAEEFLEAPKFLKADSLVNSFPDRRKTACKKWWDCSIRWSKLQNFQLLVILWNEFVSRRTVRIVSTERLWSTLSVMSFVIMTWLVTREPQRSGSAERSYSGTHTCHAPPRLDHSETTSGGSNPPPWKGRQMKGPTEKTREK